MEDIVKGLQALVDAAHGNAVAKGWWKRSPAQIDAIAALVNAGWMQEQAEELILAPGQRLMSALMLIVSEASEAVEEYRVSGKPDAPPLYEGYYEDGDQTWTEAKLREVFPSGFFEEFIARAVSGKSFAFSVPLKPCGLPSEMADIIIRVADLAGYFKIDLARAVKLKMLYNATRSQRHGGKLA